MPSGIMAELERLRSMCKAASEIYLIQGWCDDNKIEIQITAIEDFANILFHGGNSKTDVVDEKDVASPSRGGWSG